MPISRFNAHLSRIAAGFAAALIVIGSPAQAHDACTWSEEHTPASGVPSALWDSLQPTDTGNLAGNRDTTNFTQIGSFEINPYWESLDVEAGYVFAATSRRVQIWDLAVQGTFGPGNPKSVYDIGLNGLTSVVPALVWTPDAHGFFVFEDVDAPPGNSNVFAIAGRYGVGTAIFNSTNKQGTTLIYQDHGDGRWAKQTYATTIGGRSYAFTAAFQRGGVFAYDMTAAMELASPCIEARPGPSSCPSVYKGQIGARNSASYIDGTGNFIIVSSGTSANGFEIWNVSNPANPVNVMNGLTSDRIYGVAMWQQGANYYAAVRTLNQARIYNVSCITGGPCGLGGPLWSQTVLTSTNGTVTFSRSGSTPFIYLGQETECLQGNQNEWLLDVSNPSSPTDVSPQGTAVLNGQAVSYWGWYYWRNGVHGFNRVAPRAGKFLGQYFYRAAHSIFDVHRLTGGTGPTADFAFSPPAIYPNTNVTFQDLSLGSPTSWSWTFQDGNPPSSGAQNPTVQFTSSGSKQVSLTATNSNGSDTDTQLVNVLPPEPNVASVTASPNPAKVCQPITFTAQGATGQPTLSFSWEVRDPSDAIIATGGNVNPFVWQTQPGDTTGIAYTAEVTVQSSSVPDVAMASSAGVTLQALDALPASDTFAPTYSGAPNPPPTGTVAFSVNVPGATEWNWNFGDNPGGGPNNDGYEGWTSDPVNGPSPTHSYDALGTYDVRVKVRNCLESERESSAVSVQIISIAQLEASFRAIGLFCTGGTCSAETNDPITFLDESSGDPDFYSYDWDGNGSFEDANNPAPVTTHTYTTPGNYRPRLQISRGATSDVFQHVFLIQVTNPGPPPPPPPPPPPTGPSITVTGPSSGVVNQQLTYSATASNCSPNASGWSWSTSGGTISGSSSGSSITVSWSSTGGKSVQAQNSSCGSATGSRTVTISAGGGGGGPLAANFTFSPTNPSPGQEVTFDGTSSTGAETFTWTSFGDGSRVQSGAVVGHTYSQAGSYQVTLSVGKADPGCSFGFCEDSVTKTVTVGNGPPPPPPPPSLEARFDVNAPCVGVGGTQFCEAEAGEEITFTDRSLGDVESRNWAFGDGSTASSSPVTHSWADAGEYIVTLTVSDGEDEDSATKTFTVTAPPPPPVTERSVYLPWSSKSNAALNQLTALFVHNPDATERTIIVRFYKRRAPSDTEPPSEHQLVLAAGATASFPDVLGDLFGLNNVTGFFEFEVQGEDFVLPVVTAYHQTFLADGTSFGQVVPGLAMSSFPVSSETDRTVLHLQGLNDDTDRLAFFGVTNPNDGPARYRLRFFNALGEQMGSPPEQLVVGPMNLQQLQVERIRNEFGISNASDYRVEVEVLTDDPIYVYGTNLRLQTLDPSFLRPGDTNAESVTLIGALAASGLNGALFRTDAVLANPTDGVIETRATYTSVGVGAQALDPVSFLLQPGETRRLSNILMERWTLPPDGNLGFLSFSRLSGPLPLIQAETYDIANPSGRFGQFMPAFTEAEVAEAGERQILTGLQQDANVRTTIWLMNAGDTSGECDLIYRRLDGSVIDRIEGYRVPPGNMRQLAPGQHPLPAEGVPGGFTVQVIVRQGKFISAAQGVDNDTNDPKFVAGVTR